MEKTVWVCRAGYRNRLRFLQQVQHKRSNNYLFFSTMKLRKDMTGKMLVVQSLYSPAEFLVDGGEEALVAKADKAYFEVFAAQPYFGAIGQMLAARVHAEAELLR